MAKLQQPVAVLYLLDNKVDKIAGKGLSAEDFTTEFKIKLEGISAKAEENIIQTVSDDFILEERHLSLNSLPLTKIQGLQEELNKKIDAKAGYGLLSDKDQEKLNSLNSLTVTCQFAVLVYKKA